MNYKDKKYSYLATPADYWLENIDTVKKLLQASDYLEEVQGMYCLMVEELYDSLVRVQEIGKRGNIVLRVNDKTYACTEKTPVYTENAAKGEFHIVVREKKGKKLGEPVGLFVRLVAAANIEQTLLGEYRRMTRLHDIEQQLKA